MGKEVYIVHCIDTEGPLYESIEVTFEMVNQAFGIKLEPTFSNLKKLQNKDINLALQVYRDECFVMFDAEES
jgi:UDP-N-acetylglucosamine transferase subunit ALG13